MRIEIDTTKKTIILLEEVNYVELDELICQILRTDEEQREYSIVPFVQTIIVERPATIPPYPYPVYPYNPVTYQVSKLW